MSAARNLITVFSSVNTFGQLFSRLSAAGPQAASGMSPLRLDVSSAATSAISERVLRKCFFSALFFYRAAVRDMRARAPARRLQRASRLLAGARRPRNYFRRAAGFGAASIDLRRKCAKDSRPPESRTRRARDVGR